MLLLSIWTVILASFILFFIAVARVDAASYTGIYDRVNGTQLSVEQGNQITAWTGPNNSVVSVLADNWNKLGLYYHTNLSVVNGKTYYFQFQVTVRTYPTTLTMLACRDWNISAFSIRYPTTVNGFASNQITTSDSTIDKSTCITTGENENIQMNTYIFYGHFTANRNSNILGARLQIYTSYTNILQTIFQNISLTITEESSNSADVVGAINNSANSQNQNRNNNTNKIIDAIQSAVGGLKGEGANIQNVDNTAINNFKNMESSLTGSISPDSTFTNNVGIGIPFSSQESMGVLDFFDRCWNLFLSNSAILALLISILSIGVIAHLTGRSG